MTTATQKTPEVRVRLLKSEGKVEIGVVNAYEVKDVLKARGYRWVDYFAGPEWVDKAWVLMVPAGSEAAQVEAMWLKQQGWTIKR